MIHLNTTLEEINYLIEQYLSDLSFYKNIYDPDVTNIEDVLKLTSIVGNLDMLYQIRNFINNNTNNFTLDNLEAIRNLNKIRRDFFMPLDILEKINAIEGFIKENYTLEFEKVKYFLVLKNEYKLENKPIILKRLNETLNKNFENIQTYIDTVNFEIDQLLHTLPNINPMQHFKPYVDNIFIEELKSNDLLKIKKFYDFNKIFIDSELSKGKDTKKKKSKHKKQSVNNSPLNQPNVLKLYKKIIKFYKETFKTLNESNYFTHIDHLKQSLLDIDKIEQYYTDHSNSDKTKILKNLDIIKNKYIIIISLQNT